MLLAVLDAASVVAGLLAALFWYRASRGTVRRVSAREELDAADVNRIVVALNRMQILNRRAALAATAAAALVAMQALASLVARGGG